MASKKEPVLLTINDNVQFVNENGLHKYVNNDFDVYTGVTTILGKYVFPHKYDGIDEETLNKAAERGTRIHELCEEFDKGTGIKELIEENPDFEQQIRNYSTIKESNKLVHEASEYLISDNDFVASSIDKVYRLGADKFMLADVKTTYKLDESYVSWQLSIYKYLFEMQNPTVKVKSLYAIWLRDDKFKFVEVPAIDKDIIKDLLACAKASCEWTNPLAREDKEMPGTINEDSLVDVITRAKEAEGEKKMATEMFRSFFADGKGKIGRFVGKKIIVSQTIAGHTMKFNESKFALENPELYKKYLEIKETAPRITFTPNIQEDEQ